MSETISTEEQLARALLTLAEVESCVAKVERYLESNGKYLDLAARVPMDHQTRAMRAALDAWKIPSSPSPAVGDLGAAQDAADDGGAVTG